MRGGYCLGDGTGSGKGRVLTAFVGHINQKQGLTKNKRHAYISVNPDLLIDLQRDNRDLRVGLPIADVRGLKWGFFTGRDNKPMLQGKLGNDQCNGVLFCSYPYLVKSKDKGVAERIRAGDETVLTDPKQCRFGALYEWLGGAEAEGAIVFDESHKAKNIAPHLKKQATGNEFERGPSRFNPNSEENRPNGGSLSAILAVSLQRMCPKAHVIYGSATAAAELRNVGYMERLGVFGPDTPFVDFNTLHRRISYNAVSGMECLTINLKSQGLFSSRTLSYHGVKFDIHKIGVNTDATRLYKQATDIWQDMLRLLQELMDPSSGVHWHDGQTEGCEVCDDPNCRYSEQNDEQLVANLNFFGAEQRFFRVLLVAIKIPTAAKRARRDLNAGKAVVFSLWSTGEARQREKAERDAAERDAAEREKDNENSLADVMGDANQEAMDTAGLELIPLKVIERWFKTQDEHGTEVGDYLARKNQLMERIKQLQLPANPLDELIRRFGGPTRVAELTGRTYRYEEDPDTGAMEYVRRTADVAEDNSTEGVKSINNSERRAFQEGSKRVAVITEAASAGISLHADRAMEGLNKRPRVMYTLELPWAADKAVQQFGRVHRSNQLHLPEFHVIVTEMGGEIRFTSTIARRMKMLGALTRGDRRCACGEAEDATLADFDIQTKSGNAALKTLFDDLKKGSTDDDFANAMDESMARAPDDDIMSDVPSSDDGANTNTNTKGTPAAAAAASGGSGLHDAIIVDDDDDNEDMGEQSSGVGVGVPCEDGGNGGGEEAEEGDGDGDGDDEEHEDDTMPQHEYAYQKHFDDFASFARAALTELENVGITGLIEPEDPLLRVNKKTVNLRSFMNRLLMMDPKIQNSIFEWLMFILAEKERTNRGACRDRDTIQDLNRVFRGASNAPQSVNFHAHEVIARDPDTQAETWYTHGRVDRGIDFEAAKSLYLTVRKKKDRKGVRRAPHKERTMEGFYWYNPRSVEAPARLPILILAARESLASSTVEHHVYQPNIGCRKQTLTSAQLKRHRGSGLYTKIAVNKKHHDGGGKMVDDLRHIRQHWTRWYHLANTGCCHIQYTTRPQTLDLDSYGRHIVRGQNKYICAVHPQPTQMPARLPPSLLWQ